MGRTAVTGERSTLGELAVLFLRLGATGFGGPAAHIAMMEDEIVRRRAWISRERFLDLVGATNLIPGPNSTELALHIGLLRAGYAGLLTAGICFILPAALLVTLLAYAYVAAGALPATALAFTMVKPVVVVIVAQALWKLGRTAARTVPLGLLGAASVLLLFAGLNELVVLAIGAAAGIGLRGARTGNAAWIVGGGALTATGATNGAISFGLAPLFVSLFKIGGVIFGSGYVLIAFLRSEFVDRLHWISNAQLLDAVAVGQLTPGPLFTAATFIGYLVRGAPGAVVATVAIFLPGFVLVALSSPLVSRLRRSPAFSGALDGVNVASLALMLVVTVQLGQDALVTPLSWGVGALAAVAVFTFRVNASWVLLTAAGAGLLRAVIAG